MEPSIDDDGKPKRKYWLGGSFLSMFVLAHIAIAIPERCAEQQREREQAARHEQWVQSLWQNAPRVRLRPLSEMLSECRTSLAGYSPQQLSSFAYEFSEVALGGTDEERAEFALCLYGIADAYQPHVQSRADRRLYRWYLQRSLVLHEDPRVRQELEAAP